MPVPAQTPHLVNNVWIVFIKDSAFSMLYDVYLRNFDVNDRQRKEYSVLWFRQMWKKLNDLAGTTHPLTLSIEDIENSYNPSRPLYGKLQFEAKIIYSRNDGKYYHILVVDSFNYTLPYTDYYGGKRVIIENKQYNTMKNTRNRVRLTESQLHQVIKESVKRVLKEVALGGETFHGNNPEDWSALADLQTARGWRRGEEGDFRGRENDFTRASSNRRKAEQMLPPMDMSEFDQYIGDDGAYHFPDEETRNKKWSREIAHNLPLRRGSMKGRSVGKKIGLGDYMD